MSGPKSFRFSLPMRHAAHTGLRLGRALQEIPDEELAEFLSCLMAGIGTRGPGLFARTLEKRRAFNERRRAEHAAVAAGADVETFLAKYLDPASLRCEPPEYGERTRRE